MLPKGYKLRICIAGTFSYPDGYGAASRIQSYAEGFAANGTSVIVIPFERQTGQVQSDFHEDFSGEANVTVSFALSGLKHAIEGKKFVGEKIVLYREIVKFNKLVSRLHNEEPITALILLGRSLFILLPIIYKCRKLGIKIIHEKSEYPFVYDRKSYLRNIYYELYNSTMYRLFDGILVITSMLESYFSGKVGDARKVLKVPILVSDSLRNRKKMPVGGNNHVILYVGNLEHEEEILMLISSFKTIAEKYLDWTLGIVGETKIISRKRLYESLIEEGNLTTRVKLYGKLPRTRIPKMLANSDILVLPRSAGVFSTAGFPTKLGEYLMAGKPVVVTATGDIPSYLRNEVDSYLVEPGNELMFSNAILRIIENYPDAAKVGQEGRITALREFGCSRHCARIINFIKQL